MARPKRDARRKAAEAIAKAVDAAHAAYWAACDAEGRAIDPDELDAPVGLLDDAHEVALMVEDVAQERRVSWSEARQFV
jgi:hypothetical protein